jgi:hypothetical protein
MENKVKIDGVEEKLNLDEAVTCEEMDELKI